jgi:hypothetical protein
MTKFPGFSLPQGTYLPPEFEEILPEIKTLGELKVLIIVLTRYLQAGLDAQPMTFDQIQEATGLARQTAYDGVQRGLLKGTLRRRKIAGTYAYEPYLKTSAILKNRTSCMHESSLHQTLDSTSTDDMHALESRIQRQLAIQKALIERFGVAARVAEDIARNRDAGYVEKHMGYAWFAMSQGYVKSPAAFVVASIRDDWGPPLGYEEGKEEGSDRKKKCWFTDEEYELYFMHPEEEGSGTKGDPGSPEPD